VGLDTGGAEGVSQGLYLPQSEDKALLGYYEGSMHGLPPLMVGKIFLTAKYLGFHTCEIRTSGLFGRPSLMPTGKVLGIAMDKVVDISVEPGVRSKTSRPNWKDAKDFERKALGERPINTKPGPLAGSEKFRQLMVTCETDNGLEVAMFEVADPQLLADEIKKLRTKPRF
jgi:hypothetical protein